MDKCFFIQHPLDHWFPDLCWQALEKVSPQLTVLHYWCPFNKIKINHSNFIDQEKSLLKFLTKSVNQRMILFSCEIIFVKVLQTMPLHLQPTFKHFPKQIHTLPLLQDRVFRLQLCYLPFLSRRAQVCPRRCSGGVLSTLVLFHPHPRQQMQPFFI